MNPFTVPVTCDVCGGEGVATQRAALETWYGATLRHRPGVCAANLRRKAEELAKREKELEL